MRIAFLGTADIARPVLGALVEGGHEVACVVTQPDRPRGRSKRPEPPPVKEEALARGLAPILQPERLRDPESFAALRAAGPFDLGVVCAFGQILKQEALDLPRLGMVNVHASLLPRWRGAAPAQRAILEGDAETGVTIMQVVRRLDAGPMLTWARTKIRPDDTAETLLARLGEVGAALLLETLPALERGALRPVEQDEALATYAPVIAKEEGLLDWTWTAARLERHVRAMQPWPGSFTFVHRRDVGAGEAQARDPEEAARLVVLAARVAPAPQPRSGDDAEGGGGAAPAPGTILGLDAEGGAVLVACGEGTALALARLQPAGRKPMDARAWWIGRNAEAGDRLGLARSGASLPTGSPA